jgi:hypothetical protein
MGHYARECPTPKGKGKDTKGGGKGYKGYGEYKGYGKDGGYKGGYKGYGKDGGYKGKDKGDFGGKGFAGPCWRCGEVGHRAVNCPKNGSSGGGAGSNMEIGAVGEDVSTSVGGVWAIAAVSAEDWKEVKHGGKDQGIKDSVKVEDRRNCTVHRNRFEGLVEEACPEVENVALHACGWPSLVESRERKLHKKQKEGVIEGGGIKKEKGEIAQDVDFASICAVPFASCCSGGPPGLEVCTVGTRRWTPFSVGEITVDSAAEESVCPREWCKEFGTKEPVKWLKFVNASGGQMGHYGERTANFKVVGKESGIMSLSFQVSDVQKPLVAVRRIAEKGNLVHFGPRDEDNYIENRVSGVRINMVRKGGSYVIPAEMLMEEGFQRQVHQ